MFLINSHRFVRAEIQELFDRMSTQPSGPLAAKITTLMNSLLDEGIWELLDTLFVPILWESEQSRLL